MDSAARETCRPAAVVAPDLRARGRTVLAMGSPRALSQSVTVGVASNSEMTNAGRSSRDLDGEDVGSIVRWIGHDAPIYPGNSGGPLVSWVASGSPAAAAGLRAGDVLRRVERHRSRRAVRRSR